MKISLNWLKDYIKLDHSLEIVTDKLNSIGLEVDEIIKMEDRFDKVVIGKIISTEKHPNADKLNVCQVQVASNIEAISQIVCGASNVRAGLFVPVAMPGCKINGMEIQKAKLRGVESNGMICSASELGIDEKTNYDGIMELTSKEFKVGKSFAEEYFANDIILDIAITPNRGDCASHFGIARDMHAAKLGQLKSIDECVPSVENFSNLPGVDIKSSELINFNILKLDNVKIKQSDHLIKSRLEAIGSSSINNIVDITNYFMMSFGLPMHAYDAEKIEKGFEIKYANNGDKFVTIKQEEISLKDNQLMVYDAKKPVCALLVMGGLNSAISPDTKSIYLECAYADPVSIAKSARSLNIFTESRFRAERWLDHTMHQKVINLAAKQLESAYGCEVSGANYMTNYKSCTKDKIAYKKQWFIDAIGMQVSDQEISEILTNLCIKHSLSNGIFDIEIPNHRGDINIAEDITEEILRIKGIETLQAVPVASSSIITKDISDKDFNQHKFIRRILSNNGYKEVVNYAFIGEKEAQTGFVDSLDPSLRILNPMNASINYVTPTLMHNLIDRLIENTKKYSVCSVKFYEIGNIFFNADQYENTVSGILYGNQNIAEIGKEHQFSVYDAKEDIATVLKNIFDISISSDCEIKECNDKYCHPYKSFSVFYQNIEIAKFGEIQPELLKNQYNFNEKISFFELYTNRINVNNDLIKNKNNPMDPVGLSKDICFIFEKKALHNIGDIVNTISKSNKNIEKVCAKDIFELKETNETSIMFRLFIKDDVTISKDDLNKMLIGIKDRIEEQYNGSLRGEV